MAVGSFSAGLSGLNANATALSVVGNNLANINTIAFKSSAVSFQDLVSQSLGGSSQNPMQIGLGVTVASISPVFSQGAIENTGDATNVAIQGAGFFVVSGSNGQSYTRAGNFSFTADGLLATPDGQAVQGWTTIDPTTGRVVTAAQATDITISPGVLREPVPTTTFRTITNLDSASAVASAFTTSVQVYDALGQSHVMTITYTNTASRAWNVTFRVPAADVVGGGDLVGGVAQSYKTVAIGALTFKPLALPQSAPRCGYPGQLR